MLLLLNFLLMQAQCFELGWKIHLSFVNTCVYSFLHVPVQAGSDAILTVCPNIVDLFFLVLIVASPYLRNPNNDPSCSCIIYVRVAARKYHCMRSPGNESRIHCECIQDCGRHLDWASSRNADCYRYNM
jgi:hypothetical protein